MNDCAFLKAKTCKRHDLCDRQLVLRFHAPAQKGELRRNIEYFATRYITYVYLSYQYKRPKGQTMASSIEEFYQGMTDDQKKRAQSITSPEEMLAFAREEGYELTDEQLEGVAGGWEGVCFGVCEPDECRHLNDYGS